MVVGGIVLFSYLSTVLNENEYDVIVTDKQVKRSGDSEKYLIFTELTETGTVRVFENTDELFKFKFNSSDVYAAIKVGNRYKLTVTGYRSNMLSEYENIIGYKKLE